MSEMTTEAETAEDKSEADNDEIGKTSRQVLDAEQADNPAVEKAPNPNSDPNDDRMGAPAMMPD